jgi:hypothetical protein
MKIITIDIAIVIILLITTILLSQMGLYNIVNYLYIAVCFILFIIDRRLLILLYIVYLPTNGFISTEYNLFGILHVSYIVNMFALGTILLEWHSLDWETKMKIKESSRFNSIVLYFALFLFLYMLLTEYRLYLLGMSDISPTLLITRSIRYVLMFVPLILLVRISSIEYFNNILRKGFILSISIIALSMIFSVQLSSMGIATQEDSTIMQTGIQSMVLRRAGVFSSIGDVNSAAGFLAVGFAFILFIHKVYMQTKLKSILALIIILAFIAAGSRAAIGSTILVIILFLMVRDTSFREKIGLIFFIALIIFILFTQDYIEPVLRRFSELRMGEGHLDSHHEFGRLGGWLFYINYIFSDTKIVLFGATESIYKDLFSVHFERVAHNFYIQLLYRWGIFPLLILLYLIAKYITYSIHKSFEPILLAILIPFVVTLFFLSDPGVFLGFIPAIISLPQNTDG